MTVPSHEPPPVLPSGDDPVIAGAVQAIGGPPGRHARLGTRRVWTPVRWLVLLALLTSILGFWQKAPCRVHPWADEYQYTRACYTDVFALYFSEHLNEGKTPYADYPVEYPVVIGAAMEVVAKVVKIFPADQRPRRFYDVTWALLTACAVVVAVTTARLAGRRRVWDAAMVAAAPGLLLHGTTNWDLIAAALAGLGLLQWARRRPLAAGLLLGLATATKLYPVLFLVPLLFLCIRARQVKSWAVTAAALVLAAVAVTLPVYLTSPYFADRSGSQVAVATSALDRYSTQGLAALAPRQTTAGGDVGVNAVYRFFELNTVRGADWDSLWFQLQHYRNGQALDRALGPRAAPAVLNRWVAVTFLVLLGLICALALRARRRPRLPQLLFLTMTAFLLCNKVFSPQYVIWLLPLAVLARPRWRPFLAWQATEVAVMFTRFFFFVGNDKAGQGIDISWFFAAVLVRDAALVWYAWLVVRDILAPDEDPVRADGIDDDPAGGVLQDDVGAIAERELVPA